jgi:hypothetical protein
MPDPRSPLGDPVTHHQGRDAKARRQSAGWSGARRPAPQFRDLTSRVARAGDRRVPATFARSLGVMSAPDRRGAAKVAIENHSRANVPNERLKKRGEVKVERMAMPPAT